MPIVPDPMASMHVIVAGSFENGFVVYGPFKNGLIAVSWATDHVAANWEPIPLTEPST